MLIWLKLPYKPIIEALKWDLIEFIRPYINLDALYIFFCELFFFLSSAEENLIKGRRGRIFAN